MLEVGDHPDDKLASALAMGLSYEMAARSCGISKTTVYRRMQDDRFRDRVREFERIAVRQAVGLLTAGMASAASLFSLVVENDGEETPVRLKAAKDLIELSLKLRSAEEFEARIRAIEERLRVTHNPVEEGGISAGFQQDGDDPDDDVPTVHE